MTPPTQRFRRNVNPYPNHFVDVCVSPATCAGAPVPHRDTLTPPNFWQPSHVLNWAYSLNHYLPDRSIVIEKQIFFGSWRGHGGRLPSSKKGTHILVHLQLINCRS